ncbi:hypothetical protein D3C87_1413110 [compost metagenome]
MKTIYLKLFFALHLMFVLIGSNLVEYKSKTIDKIVLPYASWTGGGFGYSFFSPNVGNQTVVKVYTLRPDKTLRQDAFGTGTSLFDSRFGAVIHTFRNRKAYELMSRIIASYVFNKYPGSAIAHISVGEYQMPKIEAFNANQPAARYMEVYTGTYTN